LFNYIIYLKKAMFAFATDSETNKNPNKSIEVISFD